MAAGDKVLFPFAAEFFSTPNNSRGLAELPLIGTVAEAVDVNTSHVAWPGGVIAEDVPNSCLYKVFPLSAFASEAASSWGQDVGKYVQLVEWPFGGAQAILNGAGVETPPRSPAASGILQLVLAVSSLVDVAPTFILAFIGAQDNRKTIYVRGVAPFVKPYTVQPGRRAVGFG